MDVFEGIPVKQLLIRVAGKRPVQSVCINEPAALNDVDRDAYIGKNILRKMGDVVGRRNPCAAG
jgi:hypothetical protein